MPNRICQACNELKPHYSHKLCYLCYRANQCRWLDDVDRWVDTLEKPQCQNLMASGCMGFCRKHWKHIEQQHRQRGFQRNPLSDNRRKIFRNKIQKWLLRSASRGMRPSRNAALRDEVVVPIAGHEPLVLQQLHDDGYIYFVGSPTGPHRIPGGEPQRAQIHWQGYIENATEAIDRFVDRIGNFVGFISAADPTPGGSYAMWLFKMIKARKVVSTGGEDITTLQELLTEFDAKKHRLPQELRDINRFQAPGDVSRALREHFEPSKRAVHKQLVEEGTEHIYGDNDPRSLQVYRITTAQAANRVAQGTQWCVKNEGIAARYLKEAPLYYITASDTYIDRDNTDIQYPVLAHPGDPVQVRDVDDSTISEDDKGLQDLLAALRFADSRFICKLHNRPCLAECDTCYSGGGCRSCIESCYDCANELCKQCAQECAICENVSCGDCRYTCDICRNDHCRECINVCTGCGNIHMCDSCAFHCGNCEDAICYRCNKSECNECTEPLCDKCSSVYCSVCDQSVCEDCSFRCPSCKQQVCEEGCSNGEVCASCEEPHDEDDENY